MLQMSTEPRLVQRLERALSLAPIIVAVVLLLGRLGSTLATSVSTLEAMKFVVNSTITMSNPWNEASTSVSSYPVSERCTPARVPLDCLAQGMAALQTGNPDTAVRLLSLITTHRPWDTVASYGLGQAFELTNQRKRALNQYEQHIWYRDSADRLVNTIYHLVSEPHNLGLSTQVQLLRRVQEVKPNEIWAELMLTQLEVKRLHSTKASLKHLRFEQITPSNIVEQQRMVEAISLAHAEALLPPEYIPRILAYWIASGQLSKPTKTFAEQADFLSSEDLNSKIDYLQSHIGTKHVEEDEAMTGTENLCGLWEITDRSAQEVTSLPQRYADAEFIAIPIIWDSDKACWLQGLWTSQSTQYLSPSIVASQRSPTTPSNSISRITIRYRTLLDQVEDFRVSTQIWRLDGESEPFELASFPLTATEGREGYCEYYIRSPGFESTLQISIRLWSPSALILEGVSIAVIDEVEGDFSPMCSHPAK